MAKLPIMDTCPICQDEKLMQPFSCNHALCYQCRQQLRDVECPMCRKDWTKELGKDELRRIKKCKSRDAEERDNEQLREFLNSATYSDDEEEFISIPLPLQFLPQETQEDIVIGFLSQLADGLRQLQQAHTGPLIQVGRRRR